MLAAGRRRLLAFVIPILVFPLFSGAAAAMAATHALDHFAHQARDFTVAFDGEFMSCLFVHFDAYVMLAERLLDIGRDFVGDDDGVVFAKDDDDLLVPHTADPAVDILANLLPTLVLVVDGRVSNGRDECFDEALVVLDLPVYDISSRTVREALEKILVSGPGAVVCDGADE